MFSKQKDKHANESDVVRDWIS